MTDITPALNTIQVEETQFNAGVNESTFQRIGATANAWVKRGWMVYRFDFLGPFHKLSGGEDGVLAFPYDTEIVGVTGRLRLTGTSGTTTIDLHKITSGGAGASIWSTKLAITSGAIDEIIFGENFVEPATQTPAGVTLPIHTSRNVDQFEALRLDIDATASGAQDLSLMIWYRPR